jgi:ADP-dependent NAD(P)H-hydrate dehydratase / NAD(P)H-hydrate epimerase
MKILTVSQMQKAEKDSARYNISTDQLMENAGLAVAKEVRNLSGNLQKQNILVLVGPGNNGGDGLVAARHLYDWGADRVKVYICGKRLENDVHLVAIKKRNIHYRDSANDASLSKLNEWLSESTVVLDAIFGTGKSRSLSGIYAQVLAGLNEAKKQRPDLKIIALDLPSGLNADTGSVDPVTPFADNTITLGFPKIGLFNLPGAERAGRITTVDIGIPPELVDHVNTELLTDKWIKTVLPRRSLVSHKGTYGKVLALVGSINYLGAAFLACSGTIRVGAGLTTLAIIKSLQPVVAAKLTEVTYLPLPESAPGVLAAESVNLLKSEIPQYDVLLMGCGLGQSTPVADLLENLICKPQVELPPVVLDADGLNILSNITGWETCFMADAIFTPHAGEMARLTGQPIETIQSERIASARTAAAQWHKTVVLKGAYTVIAAPDGRVRVSPFANAGLASAGTGDVLAGAIAGMAAQGLNLFDAATCGVYLHGLAAEIVKNEIGDAGMLASDMLPVLPLAIRHLKDI